MAYDPLNFYETLEDAASSDALKIEMGLSQEDSIEDYEYETQVEMSRREQMAEPGDAIAASLTRLMEEGPEINPGKAVQREVATQMLTPSAMPTPFGDVPYGKAVKWLAESAGVDPKQLYKQASGKKYYEPREVEGMFTRGEITSAQKRNILKEQMTFQDNLGRTFKELHEVFGEILPAAASFGASVGTHIVEGDIDKLGEDAEKVYDTAGIAGDHIVASLVDFTTRPFEYAREDIIDAATWVPIGWYAKAIKGAGAGAKAAKAAPLGAKASKEAYKTYYHANNASDVIRGAASAVVGKIPVPNIIKQTFFDMYAGVDEALEVLRTKMRLSNQKHNIVFEEKVLAPLLSASKEIKKTHGDKAGEELAKLFNALVEGVEDAAVRSEASAWLRAEETRVLKDLGVNRKAYERMGVDGKIPPPSKSLIFEGVEYPYGAKDPYLFEKSALTKADDVTSPQDVWMDNRFISDEIFNGGVEISKNKMGSTELRNIFFFGNQNGKPLLFVKWDELKDSFSKSGKNNIYEHTRDQLLTDLDDQRKLWRSGDKNTRKWSDPGLLNRYESLMEPFLLKGDDAAIKSHLGRLIAEEVPVRAAVDVPPVAGVRSQKAIESQPGKTVDPNIVEDPIGHYVDKSQPSMFHGTVQYKNVGNLTYDKVSKWTNEDLARHILKWTGPEKDALMLASREQKIKAIVDKTDAAPVRQQNIELGSTQKESARLVEDWRGQGSRPQPVPKNIDEAKMFAQAELAKDGAVVQRMWDYSDKLDAYQPKEIVWTYDGVPMTSSEFIFDLSFGKEGFNPEMISYALLKDSSPVVKEYAEEILSVKKMMSDLLARQKGLRGNKTDNGVFLTEDMFKGIVSSYLPMVKLPKETGKVMDLDSWLKFTDETRRGQKMFVPGAEKEAMTYFQPGTPGTFDVPFHFNKAGKAGEQLLDEGYSIGEKFIEGLQLSIPKLIDDIERFQLYQGMESIPGIFSPSKVEGWKKLSGKPAVYRSKDAGGNIDRFGVLEGGYVPPEVARILMATEQHVKDWDHWWPKFTQQYGRVLNMVKHNKLIGNYASHAHNIYGMQIVLAAEGINPLTYFKNTREFMKGFKNPIYESQALTGTLPKSAPGFGNLDDIFRSISEASSPIEFMKVIARDMEKAAVKDGWTKAAISSLARGSPELAMKSAEFLSYQVLGLGGKMAQFFTASDRLARYTLYKSRIEKLAKINGVTVMEAIKIPDLVNDAARFAEEVMLQYSDLPFFIQAQRQVGTSPFIAYPWRAAKYAIEYPFRNPGYYKGLAGLKTALHGTDTGEEAKRREGAYPGDFLQPMSTEFRDLVNVGMDAVGADRYKDLTVSPRYISPLPIMPEEPYGYQVDRYTGADLMGEGGASYQDRRSVMGKETGINMPLPIHVEPALELAFGDPIKAAYGVLPSYLEKTISKDSLWGKPYKKRDFVMQAFTGLRHMPETNRKHALDTGARKIKGVKKSTKWKDASYDEKMDIEQEALRRSWRDRKY